MTQSSPCPTGIAKSGPTSYWRILRPTKSRERRSAFSALARRGSHWLHQSLGPVGGLSRCAASATTGVSNAAVAAPVNAIDRD